MIREPQHNSNFSPPTKGLPAGSCAGALSDIRYDAD